MRLREEDLPPLTGSPLLDPWRIRLRQHLGGELVAEPRRGPTRSEQVLWAALDARDIGWRREYATGPYRLDFFLPELRLAVEVDGGSHFGAVAAARDAVRDDWHAARGVRTLRVPDRDVLEDPRGVLWMIERECEVRRMADELEVPVPALPDDVADLRDSAETVGEELVRLASACETVLPDLARGRSSWRSWFDW